MRSADARVVVMVLPDLSTGKQAMDAVRDAAWSGRFKVDDWVLAERTAKGVKLHQTTDTTPKRGFGHGAVLGGVIGLAAGAVLVPALAVGAGAAALAKLHDRGVSDGLMRTVTEALQQGEVALFILTDWNDATMLSDEIYAAGELRHFTLTPEDADAIAELTASLSTGSTPAGSADPAGPAESVDPTAAGPSTD